MRESNFSTFPDSEIDLSQLQQSERDNGSFTIKAAAAVTVSLFVLFVIVLSYSIVKEGHDAEKRAEDRAVTASQVVATNARWVVELSRQALARIDDSLGPSIEPRCSPPVTYERLRRICESGTLTLVSATDAALNPENAPWNASAI